jgi:hypothetical protein
VAAREGSSVLEGVAGRRIRRASRHGGEGGLSGSDSAALAADPVVTATSELDWVAGAVVEQTPPSAGQSGEAGVAAWPAVPTAAVLP